MEHILELKFLFFVGNFNLLLKFLFSDADLVTSAGASSLYSFGMSILGRVSKMTKNLTVRRYKFSAYYTNNVASSCIFQSMVFS